MSHRSIEQAVTAYNSKDDSRKVANPSQSRFDAGERGVWSDIALWWKRARCDLLGDSSMDT